MAKVTTKDLAEALLQMTEEKSAEEIKTTLPLFVQYLAKKGMLKDADRIIEEYQKLYNKKYAIVDATVTLFNRLPQTTMKEIEEALKKKYQANTVRLTEKIDQRILGGMKIQVGDTVFDSTVKHSLKELEASLLTS